MTSFIAKGNIEHNGVPYAAGEEIKGLDQKQARQLIEAGAVIDPNTEVEAEAEEQDVSPEVADDDAKLEAGSQERPQSGEQSVDQSDNDEQAEAEDVSSEVDAGSQESLEGAQS